MSAATAIPAEVKSAGSRAVSIYRKAIRNGESPRFAEMVALQKAPRSSGTDTTLFADTGTLRQQIKSPIHRKMLRRNAKRMGITLTGNELYQSSLAKFPLDPRACISQAEGRTRIKKMVDDYGAGAEGAVTAKAREPEQELKPKYKVHPQIVRQLVRKEMANPANANVSQRELAERVIDKHARKKK